MKQRYEDLMLAVLMRIESELDWEFEKPLTNTHGLARGVV